MPAVQRQSQTGDGVPVGQIFPRLSSGDLQVGRLEGCDV
jgi:hypothetical protein